VGFRGDGQHAQLLQQITIAKDKHERHVIFTHRTPRDIATVRGNCEEFQPVQSGLISVLKLNVYV
jgi:hypothetical protein